MTPTLTAAPWGPPIAPAGSCISLAALKSFLSQVAESDDMECVQQKVIQRDSLGNFVALINLSEIETFFSQVAGSGELTFEIYITMYANHGPMSKPLVNAQAVVTAWAAALADTSGAAMETFITTLFPGINYGNYVTNKQLWATQQKQPLPVPPPSGGLF
jgi:hypothetical protein